MFQLKLLITHKRKFDKSQYNEIMSCAQTNTHINDSIFFPIHVRAYEGVHNYYAVH